MNTMTSRQRLDAYMQNQAVDRKPNLSLIGAMTAQYTDVPSIFQCDDYEALLAGSVKAAQDLGIDYFQNYVQIGSNLINEAAGFDPAAHKLKSGAPGHIIDDIEDIDKITVPDLAQSKLMPKYLAQATQAEAFTDELYTMTAVVGPVTTCGSLCGVENFLTYLYDDMDAVERLLDVATENAMQIVTALKQAGVSYIMVPDPTASLLSPHFYENYVMPRHQKLFGHIRKEGMYSRLHMCGDTNRILPFSVRSGADILDVDHGVHYAEALDIAKGNIIINGNIDPAGDVFSATAEHVYERMMHLGKLAKGYKALVMPGCELPAKTPVENVKQIHRALVDLGAE